VTAPGSVNGPHPGTSGAGGNHLGVLIGDDEFHAAEAALAQALEEAAPEHLVLGVADVDAEHLTFTGSGDAVAIATASDVTCDAALRTCR